MNVKAVAIEQKPLIVWQQTSEAVGGIVIAKEDIPALVYGVCPKKIVSGELVDRDGSEMDTWEASHIGQTAIDQQTGIAGLAEKKTFNYDTRTFPLTQAAQMYYRAFEHADTDKVVMASNGEPYTLLAANIPAFIAAFNAKIIAELEPVI